MKGLKIIPQKYINEIFKHNCNASLITTQYQNNKTELDIFCKKHNITYNQLLKNALRHNGCPECHQEHIKSRSLSMDEFIKKVSIKNPHIKILENYKNNHSRIKCFCTIHNVEFEPLASTILYANACCPECLKEKHSYSHIIDEESIKKLISEKTNTLKMIGEYKGVSKKTTFLCSICNNTFERTPQSIIRSDNCQCLVCTNKKIVTGYNDIATLRPDFIKYFKNIEDTKKYGIGSSKKVVFRCPDCGYEKSLKIEVFFKVGFSCSVCGDGISYPNKFFRTFIKQLNVSNLNFEYSPNWAEGYYYDCYFEYKNIPYIVEIDGAQHSERTSNFKMSLDEIVKRDIYKEKLAKENNVELIRINAKKSEQEYISSNIKLSKLKDLFDLSNIDWKLCDQKAISNFAKEVCVYVNNETPSCYHEIANVFQISNNTIRKYLKQGLKYGWCSEESYMKLTNPRKCVNVYDKDLKLLHSFKSIVECFNELNRLYSDKFSKSGISRACHDKSVYKNFIFKFANECY